MEELDSLKTIIESEAFSTYPEAAKKALLDRYNELTYGEVEAAINTYIIPILKQKNVMNDIVLHRSENGNWIMLKPCENDTIPVIADTVRKIAPPSVLKVTLPDGQIIKAQKANETFVKAILVAGLDKVRRLGLTSCNEPFIFEGPNEKFRSKDQSLVSGNLYVYTSLDNQRKKKFLDIISESLGLGWSVEVI